MLKGAQKFENYTRGNLEIGRSINIKTFQHEMRLAFELPFSKHSQFLLNSIKLCPFDHIFIWQSFIESEISTISYISVILIDLQL